MLGTPFGVLGQKTLPIIFLWSISQIWYAWNTLLSQAGFFLLILHAFSNNNKNIKIIKILSFLVNLKIPERRENSEITKKSMKFHENPQKSSRSPRIKICPLLSTFLPSLTCAEAKISGFFKSLALTAVCPLLSTICPTFTPWASPWEQKNLKMMV